MKLQPAALGLAMGILGALYAFAWTVLVMYVPEAGLELLAAFKGFMGYSISFPGALLLALYCFIDCFIFGALLAWIYNLFAKN